MKLDEIQSRIDQLSRAMSAKGLVQPDAGVWLHSFVQPCVRLSWEDMSKPRGSYRTTGKSFREATLASALDAAAAFVEGLPTAEETKLTDFMSALGGVIDMGRQNGIDVAFVNPLTETMKKLSENVLTHRGA